MSRSPIAAEDRLQDRHLRHDDQLDADPDRETGAEQPREPGCHPVTHQRESGQQQHAHAVHRQEVDARDQVGPEGGRLDPAGREPDTGARGIGDQHDPHRDRAEGREQLEHDGAEGVPGPVDRRGGGVKLGEHREPLRGRAARKTGRGCRKRRRSSRAIRPPGGMLVAQFRPAPGGRSGAGAAYCASCPSTSTAASATSRRRRSPPGAVARRRRRAARPGGRPPVRRPASPGHAPPLRRAPRDRRGPRVLGGAQGPDLGPGPAADGRPRRGPSRSSTSTSRA